VIVDTVISGGITALVIFKGNFYTDLSGFLDYIVVWLGPWFGILMVDYLLRRGRYDLTSLAARHSGLYWRNGGFNWKALLSLGLGMFAAMMWIDAAFYVPTYTGPISNATHGGDFSWLFGMIVAGGAYWILSMTSIRRETLAINAEPTSETGLHSPLKVESFGEVSPEP
jgi:cytosine/uracil/thiamine/allantoin permease